MAGIDSLISNRVDAFANNPQALMQRYAMSQDLLDLLALQKLKQEKEAVARTLQMQMQAPQGTVKDQLEGQVMDMTRREVAQAAAPGLQQQGQRMVANQMQEAMGAGLPTQPAPALQGMAQGGIVGYQEGGPPTTPFRRWWERAMEESAGFTGDPIADAVIQSKRAAEAMSPEEREALQQFTNRSQTLQKRTGLPGLFYPQSDEERARAEAEFTNLRVDNAPTGAAADYVRMMENPELVQTDFDRAKAMGLIPEERPAPAPAARAAAAAPTTPTAQRRPEISAPTEEGIAALFNDMTAPRQQEQAKEQQAPFRSRYEDRLAAIEAEKQDRMGALIDFLQAAGASGGTNLGATLMGGGSGLRAREARLKQEEEAALRGAIEDENAYLQRMFNEEQLRQQADIARQNREMQERVSKAELASREGISQAELENRLSIAKMQSDEAIKRAQLTAGADLTAAQAKVYADARKIMNDDTMLQTKLLRIQQQYKNNPAEGELQMQIETDAWLDDYLAPFGLSLGGSFDLTQTAE
jgi:hypothetical protein